MRVAIVGAGKLGFYLAECLVAEEHDVVVIEKNEERREIVAEKLDVLTLPGNGAGPRVLMNPDVRSADLMVAVTDSDEVNMIVCMAAKQFGIPQTVARIRNLEYIDRQMEGEFHRALGIDLIISPEYATAVEISRVLMIPGALEVGEFAGGKVRLQEMRIRSKSPLTDTPLHSLVLPPHILVAGIFRAGEMIIPHGDDVLLPHDHAFFIGAPEALAQLETGGKDARAARNVLIVGAGRIGFHLALMLEERGLYVKVMDKQIERCRALSQELKRGRVLCGDGTDLEFLQEEGVSEADTVVSVTEDDKLNLLVALLAKEYGGKKTIARVSRTEYMPLMEKLGVDIVVSPRLITAGVILSQARRGHFLSVSLVEGARAQAMEVLVSPETTITGKKLKDAKLPKNCLVGAVVHEGDAFVPNGDTVLNMGDQAIIFALPDTIGAVEKIF
ncbi:MAG: Trk system potassium transporter TrkA [Gracilibacteraceae bacterium]|jgi:trk system potassium uptake protein TrkA|nr:Trk system potassium transporter TrkA [Gracilibacteraceae bacterium]